MIFTRRHWHHPRQQIGPRNSNALPHTLTKLFGITTRRESKVSIKCTSTVALEQEIDRELKKQKR
jgi:hypothetical protein